MKCTNTIAALILGMGLTPLYAQQNQQNPQAPQAPEAPQAKGEQAPPTNQELDKLVRGLGDSSYKVRVQSENELRAIGDRALQKLRDAAQDSKDAEVQWRARRLVRQIERGEQGGLRQRTPTPQQPGRNEPDNQGQGQPSLPDVHGRFDDLFQQLERDFGVDIPRHRFFQDDFFQDLRGQMDAMRQQMQALQNGGGASHGMSMQIGPDGVKVEIKSKNDKGEDETKTYEAPDLQSFQQKYPGVLEQNGIGGGFRMWTQNGGQNGGQGLMPRLFRRGQTLPFQQPQTGDQDLDITPQVDVQPPPADKRLGVMIKSEIAPEVRDYLGLKPGQGLMVEEVQDDTLAQQLGIAAGDIVTRIGDHDIGNAADVQQALGSIEAGDKVEVQVLRHGKSLLLSGKKPAAEPKQLEKRRAK